MSSKQAKRERQRQRAAGEVPYLDAKRAKVAAAEKALADWKQAQIDKRNADPEKYDREEDERRSASRARWGALLGMANAITSGLDYPNVPVMKSHSISKFF